MPGEMRLMVPVHAAQAIAEEILLSFLASEMNDDFRLSTAGIWVVPEGNQQMEVVQVGTK